MKKLKEEFFTSLATRMEPFGFKYSKKKQGFVKKTAFGELWYTFLFYKYPNIQGVEINPTMQVRFKLVEDIFHRTSSFNEIEQKGTSTVGCSIENFLGDATNEAFRKKLIIKEDILPACSFFFHLFEEIVAPFFEKYSTLKNINELINSKPQKELNLIHPIFRGSKGLIIAKILELNNFEDLLYIYSNFYRNYYDGFYLSDFNKIVNNLESSSL